MKTSKEIIILTDAFKETELQKELMTEIKQLKNAGFSDSFLVNLESLIIRRHKEIMKRKRQIKKETVQKTKKLNKLIDEGVIKSNTDLSKAIKPLVRGKVKPIFETEVARRLATKARKGEISKRKFARELKTQLKEQAGLRRKAKRTLTKKELQKLKHCHHESAPRGSKTGTQGLKGNMERSVIPPQLFHEILDRVEQLKTKSIKHDM